MWYSGKDVKTVNDVFWEIITKSLIFNGICVFCADLNYLNDNLVEKKCIITGLFSIKSLKMLQR